MSNIIYLQEYIEEERKVLVDEAEKFIYSCSNSLADMLKASVIFYAVDSCDYIAIKKILNNENKNNKILY